MQAVRKRPRVITVFCILSWIGVLWDFINVFSPAVKKVGAFYPAVFGLLVALRFISLVGLWNNKRWGVELFIVTFFILIASLFWLEKLNYVSAVYNLVFIGFLIRYYRKMDVNL